ncbi:MAG: CAP domain-containing protein [Mycobacterium sp.]
MLAQLNSERAAHGKRALTMNGELIVSAHAHNLAMARADQMSHQLPGEAYFADRISAAGYQYRNAGENIGWNSAVSRSGALALESDMYAEGPPPRGIINHYSNIVSSNYTNVGIEVWIDTVHDKLWLTEDFGGH